MIINLKHVYHSIFVLVLLLPLSSPSSDEIDRKLLEAIESKTGFAPADYMFESFSLLTPFVEGGTALELLREDDDGLLLASSLILTQAVCVPAKYIIGRSRPKLKNKYRPRLYNTRITPSFPSGHAASSFAFAAIMSRRYPKYDIWFWLYAGLSGFSQMYVGNHYPSDVLAGAAIGYLTAEIALYLFERFR
jgi:membrane-associated phospholipid phosphatase